MQQDPSDAVETAAGPKPERPIDIYRRASVCLDACLPLGWTMSSDRPRSPEAPQRLVVTAPDGESV